MLTATYALHPHWPVGVCIKYECPYRQAEELAYNHLIVLVKLQDPSRLRLSSNFIRIGLSDACNDLQL
jgi:hypothetical protein